MWQYYLFQHGPYKLTGPLKYHYLCLHIKIDQYQTTQQNTNFARSVGRMYCATFLLVQLAGNPWKLASAHRRKYIFIHDQSWKSPWMKSISNELDITFHVIASQLCGQCDVISNRLWRHQPIVNRTSETRMRCVEIIVFIVINEFIMSRKK